MTDFFPLLFAVLVVLVAFVTAMNRGVVKLLASGGAAALALAVFFAGFHFLPAMGADALDIEFTWKATAGLSGGAALVGYLIARIVLGWFFKMALGPDSPFHWFVDGVPGGMLSVIPSLVVVFFLFTCTRVAGTLLELNYAASLAQEGLEREKVAKRLPPYPFAAKWRNVIEGVPLLAPALDLVDPFSHRANRNAAALVIMTRSSSLGDYLGEREATAELVETEEFDQVIDESEAVRTALEEHDRIALVTAPAIAEVAEDPEMVDELRRLKLRPVLEGFVAYMKPEEDTPSRGAAPQPSGI